MIMGIMMPHLPVIERISRFIFRHRHEPIPTVDSTKDIVSWVYQQFASKDPSVSACLILGKGLQSELIVGLEKKGVAPNLIDFVKKNPDCHLVVWMGDGNLENISIVAIDAVSILGSSECGTEIETFKLNRNEIIRFNRDRTISEY